MEKKNMVFARQAWNLLRLALSWAKRGLMVEHNLLASYIKSHRHANTRVSKHYGEREFSFDETPMLQFKMHRCASMRSCIPNFQCIKPRVDFDFDFDFHNDDEEGRKSFQRSDQRDEDFGCETDEDEEFHNEMVPCEEEGIDLKAEKFIAKFYEQMKLQRQISHLQYNEMLIRSAS